MVASSNFIKEYVGVEPTPELAEICEKRKLSIIKKKKIEDVFLKEKFDVIVSFEVIEHIFNPKSFIKKFIVF